MHWEKKICIRITTRRIIGAILAASTAVNLVIIGAAFQGAAPTSTPAPTSLLTTPVFTATFFSPSSTAGEILTRTQTSGAIPTGLSTPTDTPVSPAVWTICIKKFYWSGYRVQAGDTLFSLATATGSTVEELIQANCLPDGRIYIGQPLYLPRSLIRTFTPPPSATATNTATLTDTPTPTSTDTVTYTPTPTPTGTQNATLTKMPTYTDAPTATSTYTATPTPTNTLYITLTGGPILTTTVGAVAN
jgi:LysM repeat protein